MSKYFLHDGQNQLGPFDKSELKEKNVTVDTPVWYEGLSDWTTAGEIPDLKDLFALMPPPFKKVEKAEAILEIPAEKESIKTEPITLTKIEGAEIAVTVKKKIKLGLLHYAIIGGIVLAGIVSYVIYNRSHEKITEANNQTAVAQQQAEQERQQAAAEQQSAEQERQRVALEQQQAEQERQRVLAEQNTPEKLREKLLEKEQKSPTSYLSCSGTLEENITRQPDIFHHTETDGYLIKGYITNNATMARFKDAVILVRYYSKTMTLIGTKQFIVSEYFNPGSTTNFGPYKIYPPQGYAEWNMEIKNASSN